MVRTKQGPENKMAGTCPATKRLIGLAPDASDPMYQTCAASFTGTPFSLNKVCNSPA
jgi:hypothetical protein